MNLNFAENVKQLRKAKEITQEKLADSLGVTGQTVSRWELGICYPDLELLPAIANFFGVSIDRLLSNDAISKENDLLHFYKVVNTLPTQNREKIEFVQAYCRKYPEEDRYAYMLMAAMRDYILDKGAGAETYMPLMQKNAQRLMETRYRSAVIQMMAVVCEEGQLQKWLDLAPYTSGWSRRYCLIARSEARGNWEMADIQKGIEMFEALAIQLDSRCSDASGAKGKAAFQRDILKTIRSFGENGSIPNGWKLFYAYKQFVLAACLFGAGQPEEGWENFDAALELCKEYHALPEDWLEVGGPLFYNIKVSKDWNYAIDDKQQKHKIFGLVNCSFYDMEAISDLLMNPKWAWFRSVRETDKFRAAAAWAEEMKKKLEDSRE